MSRGLGLILLFFGIMMPAADWPQWRGPNRDGKSAETGLLGAWPKGGPPLLWKAQGLGEGYSGPAVVGDRIYLQGQQRGKEFVIACDAHSGHELWKTPAGARFNNENGNGPRGTPAVDGNRLYVEAADGTLVCLETATGVRVWGLNFAERFKARVPPWGYSESPLVEGDRVIVTPGGPGAAVVALNKTTGELIWQSQSDAAGYSSPVAFDAGGTRALAVFTANGTIGLEMKDGKLLWRYDGVINPRCNIATPVVGSGHVFVSTEYGTGCALLRITTDGAKIKASEVYHNQAMRNHYSTSVLIGDYLYGYSGEILTAMNFMTGEVA